MIDFPSKVIVERLRQQFPVGTRIELVKMIDQFSKLKPGDRGTLEFIDDIGTIFCRWDCGSNLGVVYGEDYAVLIKVSSSVLTDKIQQQVMDVRDSGAVNMMDTRHVQREALNRGFSELVIFIEENRGDYARFILYGDRFLTD